MSFIFIIIAWNGIANPISYYMCETKILWSSKWRWMTYYPYNMFIRVLYKVETSLYKIQYYGYWSHYCIWNNGLVIIFIYLICRCLKKNIFRSFIKNSIFNFLCNSIEYYVSHLLSRKKKLKIYSMYKRDSSLNWIYWKPIKETITNFFVRKKNPLIFFLDHHNDTSKKKKKKKSK